MKSGSNFYGSGLRVAILKFWIFFYKTQNFFLHKIEINSLQNSLKIEILREPMLPRKLQSLVLMSLLIQNENIRYFVSKKRPTKAIVIWYDHMLLVP